MTRNEAGGIGGRRGVFAALFGLCIAQSIMTGMMSMDSGIVQAFFWFTSNKYLINILFGALIMLLCGWGFGRWAGINILIGNKHSLLIGILCGLAVLITTAASAGWIGYFTEGLSNRGYGAEPFNDYVITPFAMISFFGVIPAVLVGIWMGFRIRYIGDRQIRNQESGT